MVGRVGDVASTVDSVGPAPFLRWTNRGCRFDLGFPTLAAILDPVAESTLRTNTLTIVRGLLDAVEPVEPTHV
jgi:hypothetical protein